jgi:hypothetical protein
MIESIKKIPPMRIDNACIGVNERKINLICVKLHELINTVNQLVDERNIVQTRLHKQFEKIENLQKVDKVI